MSVDFLPTWPFEVNNLVVFGTLLIAGVVGGWLAHRSRFLPSITGFIVVGVLLGPSVSGILSSELVNKGRVFIDVALGLILYQLGLLLNLRSIRRERHILLTSFLESTMSFVLVYATMRLLGIPSIEAALAGAVGISASPAVLLMVVREFRPSGVVTDRSITLVALNNVLSFFVYTGLLPFLHYTQDSDMTTVVFQPLYRLVGSLVLSLVVCRLLLWLAKLTDGVFKDEFPLLVGCIIFGVGTAQMLGLSPLLTLLALGVQVGNTKHHDKLAEVNFGRAGNMFYVVLFVLAGANLHLHELTVVGFTAVAFVTARFTGKWGAVYWMSRRTGLDSVQASSLGLNLVPMAGLAIGLVQTTNTLYPDFGERLSAIILASVAILETIGPIATEYALKRAGEIDPEVSVGH